MKCIDNSVWNTDTIIQMLALAFILQMISECFFPIWNSFVEYVGLNHGGRAPWFMLMASSPCLLCSTSYITNCCHNWCDIFDGAAASAQEMGMTLYGVGKSIEPGIQTSSSACAPLLVHFLESWTKGRVGLEVPKFFSCSKWPVKLGIPFIFRVLRF